MKKTLTPTIQFGLVNIPVGIAPATTTKENVKFKLLHAWCGTPIKTDKVCPECDVVLAPEDLVRGHEVSKGVFVRVEDEEYQEVKNEKQPVIKIDCFLPWEVTALLPTRKDYYAIPETGKETAYGLLAEAMAQEEVDGFGLCNLWGADSRFLLTIAQRTLVLRLLFSKDEVVEQDFEVPDLWLRSPGELDEELKMARQLVRSLIDPNHPDMSVPDEAAMKKLIASKVKGGKVALPKPEKPIVPTNDLLAALKTSVSQGKPKKVTA